MSLTIRRGRTAQTTTPATTSEMSQDIQRHRRQHWLRVHYTGDFSLVEEIKAIVGPIAAETSHLPQPLALREEIDALTDAVHEVLSVAVGMLAESRHVTGKARTRTLEAVRDLAQRPRQPQITDTQIIDGSWASRLAAHVTPYSADLSTFLARALAPRAAGLTGPSASERLEAALRVLDAAALAAHRRLPRVAARQELGTLADAEAAAKSRREAERAQAALSRIGVTT